MGLGSKAGTIRFDKIIHLIVQRNRYIVLAQTLQLTTRFLAVWRGK